MTAKDRPLTLNLESEEEKPEVRTNRIMSLLGIDSVRKLNEFKQRQTEIKKKNPT